MFFSKKSKQVVSLIVVFLQALFPGGFVYAFPHGAAVTSGKASFSVTGSTLTVNQTSSLLSTEWSSFNIWTGQTVRFIQPSRSSIAINTVLGNTASNIFGRLLANGQVWLINPNGVVFGPGAQVNTRGLLVSALNLNGDSTQPVSLLGSPKDDPVFSGGGAGSVSNAGNLTGDYYLALIGSNVSNKGTLNGQTVDMLAGNNVSLTFADNDLLSYSINSSAFPSIVDNSGRILANGGSVWLSAGARDAVARSVVNNSGVIDAQTISSGKSGQIWLLAGNNNGTVNVGGILNASAPVVGNGGQIDTSAGRLNVLSGAVVTTSAKEGKTGTWTLDPNSFYIGQNTGSANSTFGNVLNYEDISGTQLGTDLGMTSIVIDSTMGSKGALGNIYVDAPVSWNSGNTLTLNAVNNVQINASVFNHGNGNITLRADDMSLGGSTTTSPTGVPTGVGQVFVNSGGSVGTTGTVAIYTNPSSYASAPVNPATGSAYSNSSSGAVTVYDLLSDYTDLAYIDQNQSAQVLSNNYALQQNVTLPTGGSSGNWTPFGSNTASYNGTFNGQGHSISGLDINTPGLNYVGFFGDLGGTAENLGLVAPIVNGSTYVGALAGFLGGTIVRDYVAGGSVTGNTNYAGGLVGEFSGTSLANSWGTPTVNMNLSGSSSGNFGGIVGLYDGGIFQQSWFGGKMVNSSGSGTDNYGGIYGAAPSGCSECFNNYYNSSLVSGTITQPSGSGLSTAQFGTQSSFGSFSFNTFSSSGGFTSSSAAAPWFMGSVSGGGVTYTAPVLVGDMPTDAITATTRSIVYDNSSSDTVVQRLSSGAISVSGASASSTSGDVGTDIVTPAVSGLSTPGSQSGTAYFLLSGVQTITPASLGLSTTVSKTYDANNSVALTSGNTSVLGLAPLQSAALGTTVTGDLFSANAGVNLGGTVSLTDADLTGNASFLSALSHGDYILPASFSGGTITPRVITVTTTATKQFDGNTSLLLTPLNTTLGNLAPGQSGGIGSSLTGQLYAPYGRNIGGTYSWGGSVSVTGNTAFVNAIMSKDYVWSNVFAGGSVIGGTPEKPVAASVAAYAETSAETNSNTVCNGGTCSTQQILGCNNNCLNENSQKPLEPRKPGTPRRYRESRLPLDFIWVISLKNGGVRVPDSILEVSPYTLLGIWPTPQKSS